MLSEANFLTCEANYLIHEANYLIHEANYLIHGGISFCLQNRQNDTKLHFVYGANCMCHMAYEISVGKMQHFPGNNVHFAYRHTYIREWCHNMLFEANFLTREANYLIHEANCLINEANYLIYEANYLVH
jgi:hypothetical protein